MLTYKHNFVSRLGEMSEWLNVRLSKSRVLKRDREFESRSLRTGEEKFELPVLINSRFYFEKYVFREKTGKEDINSRRSL